MSQSKQSTAASCPLPLCPIIKQHHLHVLAILVNHHHAHNIWQKALPTSHALQNPVAPAMRLVEHVM
jgi:hypothetical protein